MDRPAAVDRLAALLLEKESRATEVARLLHDNAGQTLSAIGFHLRALNGDKVATAEIVGQLEQVIENVRAACNTLQTNVVARAGLPLAIELLVERLQNETGLLVRLHFDVNLRFPPPIGHAVYRIIELALDNVAIHSGAAEADVHLSSSATGLKAAIQDCGCGFAVKRALTHPPGTGLVLMKAYAAGVGMYLHVASTRSRGTIIRIQTI